MPWGLLGDILGSRCFQNVALLWWLRSHPLVRAVADLADRILRAPLAVAMPNLSQRQMFRFRSSGFRVVGQVGALPLVRHRLSKGFAFRARASSLAHLLRRASPILPNHSRHLPVLTCTTDNLCAFAA